MLLFRSPIQKFLKYNRRRKTISDLLTEGYFSAQKETTFASLEDVSYAAIH